MDIRLNEYLIKNGYLLDYTKGGIANADGSMTRFDGTVVRITKCAPAFINGKCLFDYPGCATVSLEEFKEWERLHPNYSNGVQKGICLGKVDKETMDGLKSLCSGELFHADHSRGPAPKPRS